MRQLDGPELNNIASWADFLSSRGLKAAASASAVADQSKAGRLRASSLLKSRSQGTQREFIVSILSLVLLNLHRSDGYIKFSVKAVGPRITHSELMPRSNAV